MTVMISLPLFLFTNLYDVSSVDRLALVEAGSLSDALELTDDAP